MALVKRTYVDQETVITAENLNAIQDAIIENEEAIEDQGEAIEGKYSKPAGGIPASDMASGVQTSLGKADTALQSSDIDNTLSVTGKAADAKKTGDEISGIKNTLSHKADVIYDTASGDIASFPDGADGLPVKDLTVGIEPVQSGSGDPSPDNVRPISGWTGANVSRTGKNLLPMTLAGIKALLTAGTWSGNVYTEFGLVMTVQVDVAEAVTGIALSGTPTYNDIQFPLVLGAKFPAGQYTLTGGINSDFRLRISDRQTGSDVLIGHQGPSPLNLTLDGSEEIRVALRVQNKLNVALSETMYPMVRFLTVSDSSYAPYTGTTIPISWQSEAGTVYGGTLDVTSGVLTVDRAKYTFDGTETWDQYSSSNNKFRFRTDINGIAFGKGINGTQIANWLKTTTGNTTSGNSSIITGNPASITIIENTNRIYVNTTGIIETDSVESWESYLASNNLDVVMMLATPVTYQLDPVTVNTLLGQNNVWSDTGAVMNCEYPADTKLYIQKINTPTDDDMIADTNIASGQYFIVNNNLYLSTATILAGDPIKPGTNCTLTNLAAALNALNS